MANPSFEASLSGWYGYRSVLTRVTEGEDGAWAAQVALNCACTVYTLDDNPNTVSTSTLWRSSPSALVTPPPSFAAALCATRSPADLGPERA